MVLVDVDESAFEERLWFVEEALGGDLVFLLQRCAFLLEKFNHHVGIHLDAVLQEGGMEVENGDLGKGRWSVIVVCLFEIRMKERDK